MRLGSLNLATPPVPFTNPGIPEDPAAVVVKKVGAINEFNRITYGRIVPGADSRAVTPSPAVTAVT